MLHRLSGAIVGSAGITKRSLTKCLVGDCFFCVLWVRCDVVINGASCCCVMAFDVLFTVLVVLMVSEHLVNENVNGVSAINGLESIKFLGCAKDGI